MRAAINKKNMLLSQSVAFQISSQQDYKAECRKTVTFDHSCHTFECQICRLEQLSTEITAVKNYLTPFL